MSLRYVSVLLLAFLFAQSLNFSVARETSHQWGGGTCFANVSGVPPEKVWPFIEDFCNIYKVFPINASFCDRGDQKNVSVGDRRFMLILSGPDVQWEKHHLVEFDKVKHFLTYRLMENNIKVTYYCSTMAVLPDKKHGSIIRWKWTANPVQGYAAQTMQAKLEYIIQYAAANILRLSGSS